MLGPPLLGGGITMTFAPSLLRSKLPGLPVHWMTYLDISGMAAQAVGVPAVVAPLRIDTAIRSKPLNLMGRCFVDRPRHRDVEQLLKATDVRDGAFVHLSSFRAAQYALHVGHCIMFELCCWSDDSALEPGRLRF